MRSPPTIHELESLLLQFGFSGCRAGLVVYDGVALIHVVDLVDGQLVHLLQRVDEILDIGFISVLGTDIIHDESESDAASYMQK